MVLISHHLMCSALPLYTSSQSDILKVQTNTYIIKIKVFTVLRLRLLVAYVIHPVTKGMPVHALHLGKSRHEIYFPRLS